MLWRARTSMARAAPWALPAGRPVLQVAVGPPTAAGGASSKVTNVSTAPIPITPRRQGRARAPGNGRIRRKDTIHKSCITPELLHYSLPGVVGRFRARHVKLYGTFLGMLRGLDAGLAANHG